MRKSVTQYCFLRLPAGILGLLAPFFLHSFLHAQENCLDCHRTDAPVVDPAILAQSVHRDLACGDCHGGIKEIPHEEKLPKVDCSSCHEEQTSAMNRSSHTVRLRERKGTPENLCLACHGTDAHALRRKDDPASPMHRTRIAASCLQCHKETPAIAVDKYLGSVHNRAVERGKTEAAVCADCHGSHAIDHSRLPTSSVHVQTVPRTCGKCHPDDFKDYAAGIHGRASAKGFRDAPVCSDCHGEHGIYAHDDPSSPVFAGNVTKTCASCHASERLISKFMIPGNRLESFRATFHGLSGELGDLRVANCASCHENHRTLPSADPASSIHPKNLGKTCGRCHPGAELRFIGERIHTSTERPSHWIVGTVRAIYIWMIVIVVGGMFLHNLLDLICKATRGIPSRREVAIAPRFSINERIQHILLFSSFIALVISGFALTSPDSLLALPFQSVSNGADIRKIVHRVAAALFLALGIYHAIYLSSTQRGRAQFRLLLPRRRDLTDVKSVVGRFFTRFTSPANLPHYSYVEKAEYWALVWGSVIMTVTGLMLYFINTSLAAMPVWVVDLATTVHYWEAILATLAIIVWHFYWVFLDPEVYPMNMTWLIGDPHLKHRKEEHRERQ